MIRILIADDHTLVREGIINSISHRLSDVIFGEAGTAAHALEKISFESWNLIILDINLPGRDGLDVLKEVKCRYSNLPVLILSMYPEDQYAMRMLKAGASGYLNKNTSALELVEAIHTILAGKKYISPSIARLLMEDLSGETQHLSHKSLSDREFQVFHLITSGMNISSIALELSLSVKTISVYRANILQKLGLKNNAEITHYAFKNNLAG